MDLCAVYIIRQIAKRLNNKHKRDVLKFVNDQHCNFCMEFCRHRFRMGLAMTPTAWRKKQTHYNTKQSVSENITPISTQVGSRLKFEVHLLQIVTWKMREHGPRRHLRLFKYERLTSKSNSLRIKQNRMLETEDWGQFSDTRCLSVGFLTSFCLYGSISSC